jgi:hypothetical protein
MRNQGQKSWSLHTWTVVLTLSLLCACSLGTEVGNGDRPKPSEEPTASNPAPNRSAEGPSDTKENGDNPSPPSSGPVNGGGDAATNSPSKANVQTGNPADVNCLAKGGRLEAKKDPRGNEYSLCHLPSGVTCESWAFFRGECPR